MSSSDIMFMAVDALREEYEISGDWTVIGATLFPAFIVNGSMREFNVSFSDGKRERVFEGVIVSNGVKVDIMVDDESWIEEE